MKRLSVLAAGLLPFLLPGFAQSASSASGNGPFVVPTAAAYNDLKKAATKIQAENATTFSGARIVIYDPQAFGMLSMYPSAVLQLKAAMSRMCDVTNPDLLSAEAASDVLSGAGAAASGLGALITALTPAYAIQGQAFAIDNNALIAAFVKTMGQDVVIPAYLPAATASVKLGCGDYKLSDSFVSLWAGAETEALAVKAKLKAASSDAEKKAIQAVLDSYQTMRDGYLSTDKGNSLYSKVSVAETLWNALKRTDGKTPVIIDMKIDSAGIDSTTRTVLFWKKTTFSDNLLVHYFLFAIGADNKLHMANENTVVILTRDQNVKNYVLGPEPNQNNRDKSVAGRPQPRTRSSVN